MLNVKGGNKQRLCYSKSESINGSFLTHILCRHITNTPNGLYISEHLRTLLALEVCACLLTAKEKTPINPHGKQNMKRQIQRMLGLTALALGLALGFSAPAMAANYTGSCAGVPSGAQTGNAIIGTAGTACTIPSTGANFTGTITINGSTITTTGAVTAGGALAVTGTSTVNMKALTGSSVAVNTNANITTTTINSSSSLNVATTAGTVTTGALTGGNATLQVTGTGNVTTAAVVSGGAINVTSSAGKVTTTTLTSGSSSDIVIMSNSDLQTGKVLASGGFGATSSTGLIKVTSTITTNTGANGGNVLLQANGNISSGAISTSGGAKTGGVEIDANMGGASSLFTIGSATANGVASINTSNTTGGGTANNFVIGGLFITNGTASSTGGITVTSMSAINVAASASRSGLVLLNAQNGAITLPTGTLSSNGAAGQGAGQITLLANTVNTASGTILSATQAAGVAGTTHGVVIAATTINVAGTGFQVLGNGDGITSQSNSAFAEIVPKGATTISSTGNLDNLQWSVTTAGPYNLPVTIAGSGAAFTLSANGSNATASLLAFPLTLTNGATTITSKGSTNHQVVIENNSSTGGSGLVLTGNGAVLIDASGAATGDLAGAVNLVLQNANITVPSFTIQSNAAGSSGYGGNIFFQTAALTLGTSTTSKFTANGPSSGTGNGGSITVFPNAISNLKLGTNPGELQVLANGGSTGGDGGTIDVNPFPGSITIDTVNAVSAAVLGTNGKGGSVTLIGNPSLFVTSTLTGAAINVDGKGTGDGGMVKIWATNPLTLGTAAGQLSLSAKNNGGTGKGGTIEIGYSSNLTSNVALSAAAGTGTGSNGAGGSINIHDIGQLTINADLSVEGRGTGFPGTIKLVQTGAGPNMTFNNAVVSASGDQNGDASGHDIDITSASGISFNATILAVDASSTGNSFGGSVHISVTSPLNVPTGLNITAQGASNGDGGIVVINNVTTLLVNQNIKVDGGSSIDSTHFDGSITINSVTCQQWKTSGMAWPKTFWDCVNPTAPTAAEKSIAFGASTFITSAIVNTPGQLGSASNNIQIYAMKSYNDYAEFFEGTSSTLNGALGYTNYSQRASAAFDHFQDGTSLTQYYPGTIVHELGHEWDQIESFPGEHSAAFLNAVDSDVAAFNALSCATAITGNGLPASLCTTYVPLHYTNYQIYQVALGLANPLPTDYSEAWARSFAYRGQIAINPQYCYTWLQSIEAMMTSQQLYMGQVFGTGIPF